VIDPETGELERSIPVIDGWEEPQEWQQPRPTIAVADGTAYVSDPDAQAIYAVDLASGEVWNSADLTVVPNELTVISGDAEAAEAGQEGDVHGEHAEDEHGEDAHDEHAEDEHGHQEHGQDD